MSITVMSKILRESKLPEGERFALLVLADFGNDDGVGIYASHATIAKRMNVTDRTLRTRLSNLRACCVLEWERKGHQNKTLGRETNEYRICVGIIGNEAIDAIKSGKKMDDDVKKAISTFRKELAGSNRKEPAGSARKVLSENPSFREPSLREPSLVANAPISGASAESNIAQVVSPVTETNNMIEQGKSHDLFFITDKDDIERKITNCKRSDAVKDVLKKFHALYPNLGWTKAWLSSGEQLANVIKGDLTLMDEAKKKLVGDYTPSDPFGMVKTCNKLRETRRQQVTKDEPALVQMSDGTWAKSYNPWS